MLANAAGRALATTEELIERIELAFGEYVCSEDNPCGCKAYFDDGDEEHPWRIADDHAAERFATFRSIAVTAFCGR